jgi:peptidoglycan/LPS O-acetylase OafA/YrhL
MQRDHVAVLDGVRGLAAMAVLIGHCLPGYLPWNSAGIHSADDVIGFTLYSVFSGSGAVLIFFVLSGFVLSVQWQSIPGDTFQIRYAGFIVRRVLRLTPAMWIAAGFSFLWWSFSNQRVDFSYLISAMAYLDHTIDAPLWTMPVELLCGLTIPLLFSLTAKTSGYIGLTTAIISIAFLTWPFPIAHPDWMTYLPAFAIGINIPSIGAAIARKPALWRVLAVLSLALTVLPSTLSLFGYLNSRQYIALTIPGCLVLLAWLIHSGQCKWLASASLKRLGDLSFGIYLLHYPIIGVVWYALVMTHVSTTMREYPYFLTAVLTLATIGLTLIASALIHYLVEVPSNRLGRQIASYIASLAFPGVEGWPRRLVAGISNDASYSEDPCAESSADPPASYLAAHRERRKRCA